MIGALVEAVKLVGITVLSGAVVYTFFGVGSYLLGLEGGFGALFLFTFFVYKLAMRLPCNQENYGR